MQVSKSGLGIVAFFAVGGAVALANVFSSPEQTPMGHSMEPPDTSDVAEGGPIVDVALPLELSSEAQLGERAFNVACSACHGENAAGQNGVAPPLVHIIYEPGHHSDEAFQVAVRNGVRSHHWNFGNMPPIEGLTRADVRSIVTYIRELQRENGIF